MSRKLILGSAVGVLILVILACGPVSPTSAPSGGGSTSLTLVNNSEWTVCYVYISPNTSDSWGDDWLGEEEIIRPGESRTFYLDSGFYDLRADDCDGDPIAEEYDEKISGDMTWTLEQ